MPEKYNDYEVVEERLPFPKSVRIAGVFWLSLGTILTLANAAGLAFNLSKPFFPAFGLFIGVIFVTAGVVTLLGKWKNLTAVGYSSIGFGICFTACGFFSAVLGSTAMMSNDPEKIKFGFGFVAVSVLGIVLSVGLIVVGYLALGARKPYRNWIADRRNSSGLTGPNTD